MSENGHPKTKRSVVGEAFGLLEDQLELISLEWEFEKDHSVRRIIALGAGVVLAISAFVLLQVALIQGLEILGLPLWSAALILMGVYSVAAALLFRLSGRRTPDVGEPFKGSREEFRKNLRWIQNIFS